MKKKNSVITVGVFLALVVFFTALSLFLPKSDFSVNENRELQMLPELSLEAIHEGTFQKEYDAYLSDQFEFRDFWVTAKTKLLLALGRQDMNGVFFGRDGYLIEKYTHDDFDDDMVNYNTQMLGNFAARTAEKGYRVTCAFVPSKGTVLENKLPQKVAPYPTDDVITAVQAYSGSQVRFVDLKAPLQQHNEEYIYFKTDHHWTARGAYYAYEALMKKMDKTPLQLHQLQASDVTDSFFGSTYDKVRVGTGGDTITAFDTGVTVTVDYKGERDRSSLLYDAQKLQEKSKYEYFLGGNFARVDITTDAKGNDTLLLFKDSYSNAMVPFLAAHYHRIVMIDWRFYNGDADALFDEIKGISDVLILYNTEKFMNDQNISKLEVAEEDDVTDGELSAEDEALLASLEEENS